MDLMTKATIMTKDTTATTPIPPHFKWADDGDETPSAETALKWAANLTVANGGVMTAKMAEMEERNLISEQIQIFLGCLVVNPDTDPKLTICEFMDKFGFKVNFDPLFKMSCEDAVFTLCDTAQLMEKLYFIHQILHYVGVELDDQNKLRRDIVSFLETYHPTWWYSNDIWGTIVHLVKVYTKGLLEAKPDGSLPPFVIDALAGKPVKSKVKKFQPRGRQFVGRDHKGKTKFLNRGVKFPVCRQIAKMAKPVSEMLTNAEEVPGLVSWFFGFYIQGKTMIFDSRLFAGISPEKMETGKKVCKFGTNCKRHGCWFLHPDKENQSVYPIKQKKKQVKKGRKSKGKKSKK